MSRDIRASRVEPHAFEHDVELSAADYYGREWCRCGVPRTTDDPRHPAGARLPITAEEAREFDRRRLGGHDEGEDA